MTCCDPKHPSKPMLDDASWGEKNCGDPVPLSAAALRTLDRIAEALGIATTLLHPSTQFDLSSEGPASLMEASALMRAFIRIEDPGTRMRCLSFVQAASTEDGNA